jgi:hypothetical protein
MDIILTIAIIFILAGIAAGIFQDIIFCVVGSIIDFLSFCNDIIIEIINFFKFIIPIFICGLIGIIIFGFIGYLISELWMYFGGSIVSILWIDFCGIIGFILGLIFAYRNGEDIGYLYYDYEIKKQVFIPLFILIIIIAGRFLIEERYKALRMARLMQNLSDVFHGLFGWLSGLFYGLFNWLSHFFN